MVKQKTGIAPLVAIVQESTIWVVAQQFLDLFHVVGISRSRYPGPGGTCSRIALVWSPARGRMMCKGSETKQNQILGDSRKHAQMEQCVHHSRPAWIFANLLADRVYSISLLTKKSLPFAWHKQGSLHIKQSEFRLLLCIPFISLHSFYTGKGGSYSREEALRSTLGFLKVGCRHLISKLSGSALLYRTNSLEFDASSQEINIIAKYGREKTQWLANTDPANV